MGQTKKQKVVIFDCDGVLADFEEAFCEAFGNKNRHLYDLTKRYPEVDRDLILEWVNDEENYRHLNPIFGGITLLNQLKSRGYIIGLVTARPNSLRKLTIEWLRLYNIDYDFLDTGATHKAELLNDFYQHSDSEISMVIDDSDDILIKTKKLLPNTVCLSWAQPWNDGYFPRAIYDREKMKIMVDMGDGNWKWIWSKK